MISLTVAFFYVAFATFYPTPLRTFWERGMKLSENAEIPKPFRLTPREIKFYLSVPFRLIVLLAGGALWYFEK